MKAREIMTSPAVTVRGTTPVTVAARILAEQGFAAVPVVDEDDALVGIASEADLLRERIRPDPRIYGPRAPSADRSVLVSSVMTTPVVSVTPGADAADAVKTMLEENIRCLPVVDGYRVVGVITRRDLLAAGAVRSDSDLRRDIEERLAAVDASDRWQVTVQAGVAEIGDFRSDPGGREVAHRIASAVPGVVAVRSVT